MIKVCIRIIMIYMICMIYTIWVGSGRCVPVGALSPTRSPGGNDVRLKQVKETIKRLTPKSVQKRPVTRDQLLEMGDAMKPKEDGTEVRDICILILLFIGFLRESEAIKLLFEDVSIMEQVEDGTNLGESLVFVFRIKNG